MAADRLRGGLRFRLAGMDCCRRTAAVHLPCRPHCGFGYLGCSLGFGSLSGVLCERVGVVNIAIEGQLLGGAFTAALVATVTGSPYVGLIAAAVAGAAVSMVLAVFSIKYLVNQIIVGVVLNVLVSGLTGFLFGTVMVTNKEQFNTLAAWISCRFRCFRTFPSSGRSCSSSPSLATSCMWL